MIHHPKMADSVQMSFRAKSEPGATESGATVLMIKVQHSRQQKTLLASEPKIKQNRRKTRLIKLRETRNVTWHDYGHS